MAIEIRASEIRSVEIRSDNRPVLA